MSSFSEAFMGTAVGAVVGAVVAWAGPLLVSAYKNRYIEPHKAHQQFLLNQAEWFQSRADKLTTFDRELGNDLSVDRFQLAALASRLDHQDQQWAMKIADVAHLRKTAALKAEECQENAAECYRQSEWINSHSLFG